MRLLIAFISCLISVSVFCQNEYSLSFDGIDDYTQLNNPTNFGLSSVTISIDCKLNDFGSNEYENYSYIVGVPIKGIYNEQGFKIQTTSQNSIYGNDGFAIHVGDNNGLFYDLNYSDNIQIGNWYNLTVVIDRLTDELLFYIDGQVVNSLTISSSFENIDLGIPFALGIQSEDLYHNLNGNLDNLHIWNTALSQEDIEHYMQCHPLGSESGLVGFWDFDNGDGNTAFDLTDNGNDGTINGASWSTDTPNQNCVIEGCIDELACNYDSTATIDDGSCEYITPVDLGDDIETCEESVTLDAGAGYESYLWSTGETTQTIEVASTGDYSVEVQNLYDIQNLEESSSLSLDGIDEYIKINKGSEFFGDEGDFTISTWINLHSQPSGQEPIFESDIENQLQLMILSNGKLTCNVGGGLVGESSSYNWELNTWYNVILRNESGNLNFYVNGNELVVTTSNNGNINSRNYNSLNIGKEDDQFSSNFFFDGTISHFMYWDVALSFEEIAMVMICPSEINNLHLVGKWSLDEGSGSTLYDGSGNPSATSFGGTWVNDSPSFDCNYQVPSYIPSEGLISYWPFNGNANDESGNGFNGQNNGASLTQDRNGEENSAYNFNGSAQIILPDMPSPNEFTLSAWVTKQEGDLTTRYIYSDFVGGGLGIALLKNYNGIYSHVAGNNSDGACHSQTYLTENQWNHVVITRYNSSVSFWINGQYVSSECLTENPDDYNGNACIGSGVTNLQFWNGDIDDIAFWDRPLSTEEINNLYNNSSTCISSDQVTVIFNSTGCTDETACNYDSEAICDDGSCEYITPVDLGDDIETCEEAVTLDAGSGYDSYLWSTGETTQTIEVNESGDYSVECSIIQQLSNFEFLGTIENSRYYIANMPSTWTDAKIACEESGGHLVSICDSFENDFIINSVNNPTGPLWIGYYQDTNSSEYSEPNGGWTWVENNECDYTNWAEGSPNQSGSQEYCYMYTGIPDGIPGKWDDGDNLDNGNVRAILEISNPCSTYDQISITFNTSGCTDETACNYDDNAGCDNGTCEYITPVDLGDDIETCDEFITLDAGAGYDSYLWSTGETTQSIEVYESGSYSIEAQNNNTNSLSFNGNSSYVNLGNEAYLFNNSNYATFSAWIKCSENINWNAILTRWNNTGNTNYWFGLGSNGRIHFGTGGFGPMSVSYSNENAYNNNGEWYYICVVMDHQNISYYSNGQHVGSAVHDYSIISDIDLDENLLIGAKNNGEADLFDGNIASVNVWNIALTEQEIQQFMECPPNETDDNLTGSWVFNEGIGDILNDLSENNITGFINNASWSDDIPDQTCISCQVYDEISIIFDTKGCIDITACNYDIEANCDDGSCLYFDECGECGGTGTLGCTDMSACNYDSEADCDDESCTYPVQYYDCNGNCLNDIDEDGICNELEIPGCTDQEADNYDSSATDDDGTCEYLGCTNPIAENYDSDANVDDGTCIILGCMDSNAANYNIEANQDDASCLYDIDYVNDSYNDGYNDGVESVDCPLCPPCDNDCPGDYTGDGVVSVGDLLEFLILFGNQCE